MNKKLTQEVRMTIALKYIILRYSTLIQRILYAEKWKLYDAILRPLPNYIRPFT